MALPAILGAAGRLLAKEGAKGLTKAAAKKAIQAKSKNLAREKARQYAKKKLKEKMVSGGSGQSTRPNIQERKISTPKLLNAPKPSIPSGLDKIPGKSKYSPILKELSSINQALKSLQSTLKNSQNIAKREATNKRIQQSRQRFSNRESSLENKQSDDKNTEDKQEKQSLGFFDIIKRFFGNILAGGLLKLLLNNKDKIFKGIDLGIKNWRHITRFLLGPELRKPLSKILKFTAKSLLNPFYLPGKILKGSIKLLGKGLKLTFKGISGAIKLAIKSALKIAKGIIASIKAGAKLGGNALRLGVKGARAAARLGVKGARVAARFTRSSLRFGSRATRAFTGALKGGQGLKGATQAVGTAAERSARQSAAIRAQAQKAKKAQQAADKAKKAQQAADKAKKAQQAADKAKKAQQAADKAKTAREAGAAAQKAKAASSAATTAGTVAKAARRSIRIPIIGPLLVALDSWLSGDPPSQTLFKAGGAAIGGLLGNFIPIPILGMMLGEYIGEYVGNLFYYGIKTPGGWKKAGEILFDDLKKAFDTGKQVLDWLGKGVTRYVTNWPKLRIPNPAIPGPLRSVLEAATLWRSGKFEGMHDFLGKFPLSPFKFISDNQWFGNKKGKLSHVPDPTFMIRDPLAFIKHVKNSFMGTSNQKPKYTPPPLGDIELPGDGSATEPSASDGNTPNPAAGLNTRLSVGTGEFGEGPLIKAAAAAGIKGKELAAFLAQMSHETGGFQFPRELSGGRSHYGGGGPWTAPNGKTYKAKFHGRGYIQLTHDYNYEKYGKMFGVDLLSNPDLAMDGELAAKIAVAYWKQNVRPTVNGNWDNVFLHSKAINYPAATREDQINGMDDRKARYRKYVEKLNAGQITSPAATPTSPAAPSPEQQDNETENLRRSTDNLNQSTSSALSMSSPSQRMDTSALSQRASYEQRGGQMTVLPLPMGNGGGESSGGGSSVLPLPPGSTSKMLNSYYKIQLLGNLYKNG